MLFRLALISLLLVIPFSIYFAPNVVAWIAKWIVALAPLWLPVLLASILGPLWLVQVRSHYVASVPYVILELKPGEHTPKTARAMESIFYSLHHRVSISRRTEFLTGQMRLPWNFEIQATGGTVRFFMRIPKSHRQSLELRLRSEYRDIDIDEPRDYAREIPFDPLSMKLVMREFILGKPDPYPIKTYDAYEGSRSGSSPFALLLEGLVSVGEGEHIYISYIIRPHQRERSHFFARESDTLHADASGEIASITGSAGDPRAVSSEKQKFIAAIEDALKKPSFDCGIRALYFASREHFNESRALALPDLFGKFSDDELNSIVSYHPRERITWPLSDLFVAIPWLEEAYFLHLYRRRAFFAPPYYGRPLILNTAELATVFHLPHITRASPLARARGTRLEPPQNLPV